MHNLPFEPSPETLAYFVVYMSHHIEPRSVEKYLSGIVNQLEPLYADVRRMRQTPLVRKALKGCLRLYSNPIKRKGALRGSDLQRVASMLNKSQKHDDKLFLSMLYTGFYGLLRLGELTDPDDIDLRDWKRQISITSVYISRTSYEFLLPANKVDPFFEGNKILIQADVHSYDAVKYFRAYLEDRNAKFPLRQELWLTERGTVPTRSFFISRIRLFFDSDIAGQSLRAGGETELAQNGMPPHLIQAAGRWNSDAWHRYIRRNPVLLHAFARARKKIILGD